LKKIAKGHRKARDREAVPDWRESVVVGHGSRRSSWFDAGV
jgi:hypothetical protein